MPEALSAAASITPNILRYLVLEAEERGVDLRPAFVHAGLDPDLVGLATLRVSYRQGSGVLREALRLLDDSALGLAVGLRQRAPAWGLVGLLMASAATFAEGASAAVPFQDLAGAMVRWSCGLEPDGFALRLSLPYPHLDPDIAAFLLDEAMASSTAVLRHVLGRPEVGPVALTVAGPPPAHAARYAEVFGCPVRFRAQTTRCVFPADLVRAPLTGRDRWTYAEVLALLTDLAADRRTEQDLLEGLQRSVAAALPDVPAIGEQARRRGLSERTLRRRLADCGLTYSQVVDDVRRERAEQLLSRGDVRLGDVPSLLGYRDTRTLRRAVLRWHGCTPSALRRARRGPVGRAPAGY